MSNEPTESLPGESTECPPGNKELVWTNADQLLREIEAQIASLIEQRDALERQARAIRSARACQPGRFVWTKENRRAVRVAAVMPADSPSGVVIKVIEDQAEKGFDEQSLFPGLLDVPRLKRWRRYYVLFNSAGEQWTVPNLRGIKPGQCEQCYAVLAHPKNGIIHHAIRIPMRNGKPRVRGFGRQQIQPTVGEGTA